MLRQLLFDELHHVLDRQMETRISSTSVQPLQRALVFHLLGEPVQLLLQLGQDWTRSSLWVGLSRSDVEVAVAGFLEAIDEIGEARRAERFQERDGRSFGSSIVCEA